MEKEEIDGLLNGISSKVRRLVDGEYDMEGFDRLQRVARLKSNSKKKRQQPEADNLLENTEKSKYFQQQLRKLLEAYHDVKQQGKEIMKTIENIRKKVYQEKEQHEIIDAIQIRNNIGKFSMLEPIPRRVRLLQIAPQLSLNTSAQNKQKLKEKSKSFSENTQESNLKLKFPRIITKLAKCSSFKPMNLPVISEETSKQNTPPQIRRLRKQSIKQKLRARFKSQKDRFICDYLY